MYLLPAIAGTPTRNIIHNTDALTFLRSLPDESVHCMVTSPPYWGLRDYGVAGQLGMESTLAEYISNMVVLFREARRVLRSDGVAEVDGHNQHAIFDIRRLWDDILNPKPIQLPLWPDLISVHP